MILNMRDVACGNFRRCKRNVEHLIARVPSHVSSQKPSSIIPELPKGDSVAADSFEPIW
jgi:hypothetical protein